MNKNNKHSGRRQNIHLSAMAAELESLLSKETNYSSELQALAGRILRQSEMLEQNGTELTARNIELKSENRELRKNLRKLKTDEATPSASLAAMNEKLQREINERRITEKILFNNSRKYETIFNSVYDALFIHQINEARFCGNFIETNLAASKLLGYSQQELKSLNPDDLIYEQDMDTAKKTLQKALNNEEAIWEGRLKTAEGRLITCEVRCKVFSLGDLLMMVAAIRDISAQKLAEQELRDREKELLLSQQIAHIGNWRHDILTGKISMSEEARRIFGYDKQTVTSETMLFDSVHPDDKARIMAIVNNPEANCNFDIEYKIIRPDNKIRHIRAIAIPEYDENNNMIAVIGTDQDITEKRETEEKLSRILQVSSDGIWEWDIAKGTVFHDGRMLSNFGFPSNCTLRQAVSRIRQIVHPEDYAKIKKSLRQKVHEKQITFEYSYRARNNSGNYLWILSRGTSIRDAKGRQAKIVGCVEDITLSQRFDELKERFEFQQNFIDKIPIPVYYKDKNGRYLGYNRAFIKTLFASPPKSLIGQSVIDIFPENNLKVTRMLAAKDSDLIQNGGQYVKTVKITNDAGEQKTLIVHKSALYDKSDGKNYLVGALVDATALKKAEKNLRDTTQQLNMTLNSMREIIMCFDCNLKLQWANRAARETLSKNNFDFIGRSWHDTWSDTRAAEEHESVISRIIYGLENQANMFYHQTNGKIYEVCLYPIKSPKGKVSGFVETALDVTDREEAQTKARIRHEQLIQADKLKSLGTLVAGMAHEINNPNNFIMINSDIMSNIWKDALPLLQRQFELNGPQALGGIPSDRLEYSMRELLDGLREGAERIKNIVESLKTFSRYTPTSNTQHVFSINDAVDKTIFLLKNMINKTTVNFVLQKGENLPPLLGIQQRIEQVIMNILQNSCQALEDNIQNITLKTYSSRNMQEIIIEITDEGCGISSRNLKRVMDPFFTTKRNTGGTGLGLSISSSIIKQHHGKIEIKQNKPHGTRVIITLPSADALNDNNNQQTTG